MSPATDGFSAIINALPMTIDRTFTLASKRRQEDVSKLLIYMVIRGSSVIPTKSAQGNGWDCDEISARRSRPVISEIRPRKQKPGCPDRVGSEQP
jgi:hypothetical protein